MVFFDWKFQIKSGIVLFLFTLWFLKVKKQKEMDFDGKLVAIKDKMEEFYII